MSDDLVAWLRVQLNKDERVAPRVHSEDCALHAWLRSDVPSACDCGWPDRVLRDVEAKWRILELHGAEAHECVAPDDVHGWTCTCYERECPTLRLLALPYADRPGYRSEWAPSARRVNQT